MYKTILVLLVSLAFMGCASMNDAMTPSLRMQKDSFDGATLITQPVVSSASSMSEEFHVMGFDWTSKSPDIVYVTAGVVGIVNVEGLAFNVDGAIIDSIKPVSATTERDINQYASKSTRRFAMSWPDFKAVSAGKDVKMKVSQINTYSVSSFGSANDGAIVNTKFAPFISKVGEQRAALGLAE